MEWNDVLQLVLLGLGGIVSSLVPFAIKWLLAQSFVKKLHLESLVSAMIPQIAAWVEWWAENWDGEGEAPKGKSKLDKAISLLNEAIPETKKMPLEHLTLRFESHLMNGEVKE